MKILDERTDDGVVTIHISGVNKVDVTSVGEVMRFDFAARLRSECAAAICGAARWSE